MDSYEGLGTVVSSPARSAKARRPLFVGLMRIVTSTGRTKACPAGRRHRMIGVGTLLMLVLALAVPGSGFAGDAQPAAAGHGHIAQGVKPAKPAAAPAAPKLSKKSPAAEYTPNVRFRLRTELGEGKMAFVGVGGEIEGVVNPTLRVSDGDVVQVSLVNNDGVEHDVVFPDFKAGTDRVNRKGASSVTVFRADKAGEYAYFCSLPGHRQAGMEGKLVVGGAKAPVAAARPSGG